MTIGIYYRELVAKRKGAGGKHSFTWRLTILAEHLQANRISPLIMHQFFTQVRSHDRK